MAHVAVCVPDADEAVAWYERVLGLTVLARPYLMEGDAITHDMGELVPAPVAVKAGIVGIEGTDHVIEVIEYPNARGDAHVEIEDITQVGITHIGLICDDLDATRAELEAADVEFLTAGIADVAGLRTTWFRDPWGIVFILLEKTKPDHPYWRQY
jgi:catechol 2,3-dioxygenase-like lactoylglutathione lyase family enzyme